ncbi:hypothetical protein HDR66_03425, partial [bacterium]|nr:hypothetical protein [bacterium]
MNLIKKFLPFCIAAAAFIMPAAAYADWGIVDSLNLAPFVPIILDAFMTVATGVYQFFVGNGGGIIYILIWLFLAISISLYLVKMYFPKTWGDFFGFSGSGKIDDAETTVMNVLKPGFRAIIAAVVLLQVRPVYVTQWLVNPFLEFGAIYTHAITDGINAGGGAAPKIKCPDGVTSTEWISSRSCEFMTQPISDISHVNNQIIKRGFDSLYQGLRGLITLIPHGGEDFLNVVTGLLLITTFVGCNLFMALLIIQAIFNFGVALIMYPFSVLTWVATPRDRWFDIWPAFSGITKALQQMVITMIACAFILTINVAVVRALFNWNSSVFVVAAGGSATSNVPNVARVAGFGAHSVTWMSAILTFYLMLRIFDLTRKRLNDYAPASDTLYKQVTSDAKTTWKGAKT